MAFCTDVPIQTIAGSECIGDSLSKINNNFSVLGETACSILSAIVSLSANPISPRSTSTIQFSSVGNKLEASLKLESINLSHLAFEGGPFSNRNKIINGEMMISQRYGTLPTLINSRTPKYTLDRWVGYGENYPNATFTVQQSALDKTYCLKTTVVDADISIGPLDSFGVAQKIEGFQVRDFDWGTAGGTRVTLSFYVKSSIPNVFYGGSLTNGDGTRSYTFLYDCTTTDWEKKNITIPGDKKANMWNVVNNQTAMILYFSLGEGVGGRGPLEEWTDGNFRAPLTQSHAILQPGASLSFAGVQLEFGEFPTPLEVKTFDEEFTACKRYYEKSYLYTTIPGTPTKVNSFVHKSTTMADSFDSVIAPFSVEKRTVPGRLEVYSTNGAVNMLSGVAGNKAVVPSTLLSTKLASFQPGVGVDLGSNKEYTYHWAVDAEL